MIGLENFKYSFKDTLKENTGLSVYRTGYEKCCPDHQWGPGVRDHYLVHYVSSGEGTYCCGGQTYVLHEGDLFTIFPAQVVEYHAAEKTPWEYYWVGFNGADAHRMVSMAGFSPDSPVQHAADPAIREALLRIYRASGNTPSADVAMAGYLQLFWHSSSAVTAMPQAMPAGAGIWRRRCGISSITTAATSASATSPILSACLAVSSTARFRRSFRCRRTPICKTIASARRARCCAAAH